MKLQPSRSTRAAHRQRGIALFLVLMAMASALILALTFLSAQSTTIGVSSNGQNVVMARAIAESGLRHAIHEVKSNSSWRSTFKSGTWVSGAPLYGGTVTITGVDGVDTTGDKIPDGDSDLNNNSTDPVTLAATGTYGGVSCTLRARVDPGESNVKTLLLIVPNPKSLSTDETARLNYFKALGWAVNTLSESSTQAQIDNAVEKAWAIYVPSSVTAATLGNKLLNAEAGVIIEQADLCDDIGFSKQTSNAITDTSISVANNSHYITQGLATGVTAICSSSQPLRYYASTLGGGVTNLAKNSAGKNLTLGVIDAGGNLYGGGTASSRRVVLPWGGASFAWSSLNAVGLYIAMRAADWAAGAGMSVTMGTPLLVVSELVSIKNSGVIDSFDSSKGAYSSGGAGKAAVVSTNSKSKNKITLANNAVINGDAFVGPGGIPSSGISTKNSSKITGVTGTMSTPVTIGSVTMPSGMPTSLGNVTYNSGTVTLSSNLHTSKLTITNGAILHVTANATIQCDSTFVLSQGAQIKIDPGVTLKLYAAAAVTFSQTSLANTSTHNPVYFQIYSTSSSKISVRDSAQVYAVVLAPKAALYVAESGQFMGTYYGKQINLLSTGQIHADAAKATATTASTVALGSGGTGDAGYTYAWLEKP